MQEDHSHVNEMIIIPNEEEEHNVLNTMQNLSQKIE
jgi:hypothetical protein